MIHNSIVKIICLLLIVGLNWTALLAIGQTLASFSDTETSTENVLAAGILDFSLTNTNIEEFIGVTLGEDIEFTSVITKMINGMDIQYKVYAEKISGNNEFCEALQLEAFHRSISYDGDLLSFDTPTTTDLGTWAFEIKLPHTATNFPHKAECNVDLVFQGWRDDVPDFNQSGFTDEERIHLHLTSRMIVLNEFLPNPDPSANGFNFGQDNDQKPKGEWVELYNNSSDHVDLKDWYLTDDDGHRIDIEPCRTNTGNTIIPAKGYFVVYKNEGEGCDSHSFSLNNDGDTVKLFNNEGVLIDSYSYDAHDYCQLEPTPGSENSDITGNGNCEEVPPNKSYARIPDGIGVWVDPIPTPGAPNVLENNFINSYQQNKIESVNENEQESLIEGEKTYQDNTLDAKNLSENIDSKPERSQEFLQSETVTEDENSTTTFSETFSTEPTSTESIAFEETPFVSTTSDSEISNESTAEVTVTQSSSSELLEDEGIIISQESTTTEPTSTEKELITVTGDKEITLSQEGEETEITTETPTTTEIKIFEEERETAETDEGTTTQEELSNKTSNEADVKNADTATEREESMNETGNVFNPAEESDIGVNIEVSATAPTTSDATDPNSDAEDINKPEIISTMEGILPKGDTLSSTSSDDVSGEGGNDENNDENNENDENDEL